jgi:ketosteroid isomerase-like protein
MKADKQTEAAVMAVFHKFFEAYTANDLDTAMGTVVQDPDVVFLGAGQDERRVGPSEARIQMQRDLSQVEGIRFKDEWHHVSASGDVAWMVTDGTLSWMAGGAQQSAPSRISVVFVKRNDQWFIAQFHFSFIELRQAEGQSFPSQP